MTHPMIEEAARAIDPRAYRAWQSMYDFCISQGDSDAEAKRHADASEGENIKKAEDAALIACLIAIKACENNQQGIVDAEEGLLATYNEKDFDMETKTLQFTRVTSAKQALLSLRALSEQIGEA